jgi:homocysteine S-methyltransferase
MHRLMAALDERVVIGDGAMGTMIYSRGFPLGKCYEELNLSNPRLIKVIHKEYVEAGAELIETNTFQANRIRLKRYELESQVAEINAAGARVAREAGGKEALVAGSIGPIAGASRAEEFSEEEKFEAFREQAAALAEGGCDALILETFTDLEELRLALRAARKACGLPVVAQMSFHEKARTPLGVSAEEAVAALERDGAEVMGVNCSVGPHWALGAVEAMGQLTRVKLSAFPNAGMPQYVDGRYMYLTTPDYFVQMARKMVAAGVNLIGGCCGTDPAHIRALAEKLKNARPMPRAVLRRARVEIRPPEPAPAAAPPQKTFFDRVGKEPVIVVELDPPRTLDLEKTLKGARRLKRAGVDAITVGDNPLAIIRVGNLSVAALFERERIPTIVHVSCRDRNLIGLQSYVMEAHLMGITSLLAITGDPARVGDQPNATSVYDVNSTELIRLISMMNEGRNYQGNPIKVATRFRIGCAFNPNKNRVDHEISRLKKKIKAGAHFALSQPCYDPKVLRSVWKRVADECPGFPLFFGLLPPVSARNAEFLANEVPGITMPRAVIDRMRSVPEEKQMEEGIRLSKELVDEASEFTRSFYMILPFNRAEIGVEFVRHVRQLPPRPQR